MKIKIKILIILFYLLIILIYIMISEEKLKPITDEKFKQKIDYNNSLTSLACSIEKYFDIPPLHKTLPYIDELLNEKKPDNVILLLIDGLGSRIMDKILNKNDFLIKNRKKEIFTVFPPTTSSCLNTIKKGLNPSEHGWTGWTSYVKPINKIIALYKDIEKGQKEKDDDFLKIKDKYYYNKKTITELINEAGKYLAYELTCYPYNVDRDIDSVFHKILETLKIKGKKYIFAYYPEPDDVLHAYGYKSTKSIKEIEKINQKVEEYSKLILENKNTMLIITADHGHLISNKVDIREKEISKYLITKTLFVENRSPGFLVKKGEEENFKKAFYKEFGNDFYLLSKEEILDYEIFGEYSKNNKHELFESSFGDFMAFAKDSSNMCLIGDNDNNMYSYHGGYSDDEIYIPLIVISN